MSVMMTDEFRADFPRWRTELRLSLRRRLRMAGVGDSTPVIYRAAHSMFRHTIEVTAIGGPNRVRRGLNYRRHRKANIYG